MGRWRLEAKRTPRTARRQSRAQRTPAAQCGGKWRGGNGCPRRNGQGEAALRDWRQKGGRAQTGEVGSGDSARAGPWLSRPQEEAQPWGCGPWNSQSCSNPLGLLHLPRISCLSLTPGSYLPF